VASQLIPVACTVALLVPLWYLLSRDFTKGLAYAVFLCVSMPTVLRIQMPGSLPQLTIYRLALIVVFLFWLRHRDSARKLSTAPLFGLFFFWAAANLTSLLCTTGDFVTSLKRYLDFVVEAALFFFLLATSLRSREDAFRILRAAWLGVTLVAALAFVEKYTAFNPVNYLVSAGAPDADLDQGYTGFRGDVTATYQHRILLGTGMAMGWSLALALLQTAGDRPRRRMWLWLSVCLLLAGCYFGNSRGPWLAAALAGGVLALLAGAAVRRKLAVVLVVALAALVLKPGVLQSLTGSVTVTMDDQSFKGGTFRYRLELWKVAWAVISQEPVSLLFGCGPGCGLGSTVDWKLSYRGGREEQIWSWDNQLAYDLYQSGVVGLAASLALYGGLLLAAYRFWREAGPNERGVRACLLAGLLAYTFMLTNVLMFTKPVNFLFWSIAAVAYALGLNPQEQEAEEEAAAGVEAEPASFEPQLSHSIRRS
jgi:O-antigen ligase